MQSALKCGRGCLPLLGLLVWVFLGTCIPYTELPDGEKGNSLEESVKPLGSNRFWAADIVKNVWYEIDAQKIADGRYCTVWRENGRPISPADGQKIANEFDTNIYQRVTKNFGGIADVNGSGKVLLLLLDIRDGYVKDSNSGFVGGYFDPYHMYDDIAHPYSNRADMLYIDVDPLSVGSGQSYSTTAHELVHLVHFSQTTAKGRKEKDTWINEGFATAGEYLYGGDPNDRAYYQLLVNHGLLDGGTCENQKDNFYRWDNHLEDYSTAYLFFQWLRIHAGGSQAYKAILEHEAGDYRAVLDVVKQRIAGAASWGWKDLLGAWYASGYYSGTSEGLYGYKGFPVIKDSIAEINAYFSSRGSNIRLDRLAVPLQLPPEEGQLPLYSGEAVLSKAPSNGLVLSGSTADYLELGGTAPSSLAWKGAGSSIAAGKVFLGMNSNTVIGAAVRYVKVGSGVPVIPAVRAGGAQARTAGSDFTLPPLKPGVKDVQFNPDGTIEK